MKTDKRGTWLQALGSLTGAVLLILTIRWALFEPYVIPSGSMLPTLQIRDHIFVNKFAYGIRLPFSSHYLIRFGEPKRGDIIVFRSVDDDDIFLVKRVVGLPGETLEGVTVPPDSYFMMGDNRENSADSRVWGVLPMNRILGRASLIWLSCEETLSESNQLCDPSTIRWNRIFMRVE
ncbi:MAG TPA: signal peptidase I [Bdellovibrionales bacterium]|nr:signal peptidase I [Bdellovibrionales bacterium]